jgi:methionine synthase I (cobalamin-dependent)
MSVSTPTPAVARLEELLLTRILVLDGAMGTMIQTHHLDNSPITPRNCGAATIC